MAEGTTYFCCRLRERASGKFSVCGDYSIWESLPRLNIPAQEVNGFAGRSQFGGIMLPCPARGIATENKTVRIYMGGSFPGLILQMPTAICAVCPPAFDFRVAGAPGIFVIAVRGGGSFDPFAAADGAGVGPGAADLRSGG